MSESNIVARPYAKAIFEIALKHNQLTQWSKLLKFLAGVSADPHVGDFLRDPRINYQQRSDLFVNLCGEKLLEDGNNFLRVLAANRRLINLPEIYILYENFRTAYEKKIKVEVEFVNDLTEKQKEKLHHNLTHKFKSEVEIEYQQNEKLIGGLIIRVGDYVIDGSVRGQLARLKKQLFI